MSLGQSHSIRYEVHYHNGIYNYLDPKGWDNIKTVIKRGDNFGLNIEVSSEELSFPDDMYNMIRQAYYEKGYFAVMKIYVYVQDNQWEDELYQIYSVDFSQYSDDGDYAAIKLIANTTMAKINANYDTDYEIDLDPSSQSMLTYSGASIQSINKLSYVYERISDMERIAFGGNTYYIFGASRSTRAYNSNFEFNGTDGLFTGSMKAKAVNAISATISVALDIKSLTIIYLIKYNPTLNTGTVLQTYNPDSNYEFNLEETDYVVSLASDEYIALAFKYYSIFSSLPVGSDFSGTYLKIKSTTLSGLQDQQLSVFTFDWLISQLLLKIDSTAVLVNNLTNANIQHMLSSSANMRQIGSYASGIVTTSLKDAIQSLHALECLMIDITDNVVTINPMADAYKDEQVLELECNSLKISHDATNIFNKISVGSSISSNENDGYIAFNIEKTFNVAESEALADSGDSELDLKCTYITEQYTIDQKISDFANNSTKSDSDTSTIIVFACEKITIPNSVIATGEPTGAMITDTLETQYKIYFDEEQVVQNYTVPLTNNAGTSYITVPFSDGTRSLLYAVYSNTTIHIELYVTVPYKPIFSYSNDFGATITEVSKTETYSGGTYSLMLDLSIETAKSGYFYFDFYIVSNNTSVAFTTLYLDFEANQSGSSKMPISLYQNQIIKDFDGDSTTSYNVPYTPRRILNKHLSYISISNWNSENKLKYTSGDNDSNISSKLAYETEYVEENADVTTITPIFLPIKAEIGVDGDLDYVKTLRENKYGYIKTTYNDKVYKFWVEEISVTVAEQEEQTFTGYLKSYDL